MAQFEQPLGQQIKITGQSGFCHDVEVTDVNTGTKLGHIKRIDIAMVPGQPVTATIQFHLPIVDVTAFIENSWLSFLQQKRSLLEPTPESPQESE